jgi:hypothetical protein
MELLLAPLSGESVRAPAASPWFWGSCLAGMGVIAIPSQTLHQAEFERVVRVSVNEKEMERSQQSNRAVQIYPNKQVGESMGSFVPGQISVADCDICWLVNRPVTCQSVNLLIAHF